jgi:hypothetical protein
MNPITWFLGLIQHLWKFIFKQRDKNLYSLDHAILHVQTPPPSLWMNMGHWKVDSHSLALSRFPHFHERYRMKPPSRAPLKPF